MSTNSQGTQKDVLKKAKKEPDFYIYRLTDQHRNKNRRGGKDPEFPPTFSIPNTSIIKWPNKNEKGEIVNWTTRKLRYIKGEESIFQSEQRFSDEDEKNLKLRNPHKPVFGFGELRVPSYDKPLLDFMDMCSMNEGSEFRLDNAHSIFIKIDEAKDKQKEIEVMQKRLEAMMIAKSCKDEDMLPHAIFLGIETYNNAEGAERDIDLIRLDYQNKAMSLPEIFMESVNNPKLRTTAMVKKAIAKSEIWFDRGGVAKWSATKAVITTIPSDKERVEFLTDFSLTEEGSGFAVALKALDL